MGVTLWVLLSIWGFLVYYNAHHESAPFRSLTQVSANPDYICKKIVDYPCEIPSDGSTCETTQKADSYYKVCRWTKVTEVSYYNIRISCDPWYEQVENWGSVWWTSGQHGKEYISNSEICYVEEWPIPWGSSSSSSGGSSTSTSGGSSTSTSGGSSTSTSGGSSTSTSGGSSTSTSGWSSTSSTSSTSSSWGDNPKSNPWDCTWNNAFNWSDCIVSENWTTDGKITCKQTGTPKTSECKNTSPSENIVTLDLDLTHPNTDCANAYANNVDSCKVKIAILKSGEIFWGKTIQWNGKNLLSLFEDASWLFSDRINGHNNDPSVPFRAIEDEFKALVMPSTIMIRSTDSVTIPVKSVSPLEKNDGSMTFKAGNTYLSVSNINYSYLKPLVGKLYTQGKDLNWNGFPFLNEDANYKIEAEGDITPTLLDIEDGETLKAKIMPYSLINPNDLAIKTMSTPKYSASSNSVTFSGIISSPNFMPPWLKVASAITSYTLGERKVKYLLTWGEKPNDATPITIVWAVSGIRVIGGSQWQGKSEFTSVEENMSDLGASEFRTLVRKNAYQAVASMTNGQIVNGIKYVEGDASIGWAITGYETLVVKDGNVTITSDLNPANTSFGIIVIKDNYSLTTGYSGDGNVYVKPNVTKVNAIIYADGAMVAVDTTGKPFATINKARFNALTNQLWMNGSLFTRNTIGGTFSYPDFKLPWGEITKDFTKAIQYDLNYLRSGNDGAMTSYKEPFVIKYNPALQSNPPKLFTQ